MWQERHGLAEQIGMFLDARLLVHRKVKDHQSPAHG